MRGSWICVISALLAFAFAPRLAAAATPSQVCAQDNSDQKYSTAIADCTQAIAFNPKDESAYNNRCYA